MANGDVTLNELSTLIAQLHNEREEVESRLAEVDEQLRAVEITMRLCRKNGLHEPDAYKSLASELKGKKQLEALVLIASRSGDSFKVVDAKRLMLEAGLIKRPKNALSMLYTLISRSGRFKRVAPGEYRLITTSQPSLLKS